MKYAHGSSGARAMAARRTLVLLLNALCEQLVNCHTHRPSSPRLFLWLRSLKRAAQTDAAIAASARGDALTTTLGYVQRRAALRDITNHI